ncbi:MAG: hypothetical protein RML14_05475 [Meiothermus sp.]|uniref:RAMP superfamily CRISPR-associated protein n=1 Tax=Meiothermus sp. TaxID=1955249 RepID=UPI00298F0446|nr:RAMP superfamily CRISPR-associated protein [Meiothermus sp.]MDW8481326.1 hypothetical protein [Meiothermus sp.]
MERFFLHPFNSNQSENLPEASGLVPVEFTLELTFSLSEEEKETLRRALRAWIAFGGIGARTRRGVGALEVTENAKEWLPSSPEQLRSWFSTGPTHNSRHTTLAGAVVCLGQPRKPGNKDPYKGHSSWRELGRFWARFRKGHFVTDPNTGETMPYTPMAGRQVARPPNPKVRAPGAGTYRVSQTRDMACPSSISGFSRARMPLREAWRLSMHQGKRMASPVILKRHSLRRW